MALPWLALVLAPGTNNADDRSSAAARQRPHTNTTSPDTSQDDPALVVRVIHGDVDAFEQLFRRHHADLVGFAESLLGARDIAEDVVQGVWWEVWEHRDRLDATRSVRGYLFASVRNRTHNARRDQALALRRAWESAVELQLQGSENGDDDARREEYETVFRAVQRLSERDREVLMLRLRGLTFAEIGEMLGVPLKTVATRSARTLERLKRLVLDGA